MAQEMTFREAIALFQAIYHRFEKIEGRPWGAEGAMIELSKQVGDLAKHVLVAERYYFVGREKVPGYETTKEHIADELADIFGQLIRLADHYQIDLVEAHVQARQGEAQALARRGV